MLFDPIPTQPSKPQTAWFYWIATFLLLYGALLYVYLTAIWPLSGFSAGFSKHADYLYQGFRGWLLKEPMGIWKWHFYTQFMGQHTLWLSFILRLVGGFILLPGLVIFFLSRFSFKQQRELHVRGLQYEPDLQSSIRLALQQLAPYSAMKKGVEWFHIHPKISIPPNLTNTGLLCMGAVGAGKTNFLLPFLQQVVASKHRSFILDIKGDFTEKLNYPNDRFILIAPWDERGWRWDIAKDITTLSQARLFAESCIPMSDEPLWATAARQIFAGLLNYLCITRRGAWDLLDFVELTRLENEELKAVVRFGNPDAERIIAQVENRTGQSILINLSAFIGPLADLAWGWRQEHQAPSFSIEEWLSDESSLPKGILLQSRRRFGEMSETLTNALVTLLTDRMVDTAFPEAENRPGDWRLYMVLDEIAQSRRIEALQSLSSAGRSKGLHLIVGIQSITQLKKIYSPEFADLLYTNLLMRYIGRTPDGDSAEWIASKLGMREIERLKNARSLSQSEQGLSNQDSWDWQTDARKVLLPFQLSAELGPDYQQGHIRGLLSVSGWPHVLRLAWPKIHYPTLRPALITARWSNSLSEIPPLSGAQEAPLKPQGELDLEVITS
ncbi:MAG: type IV secretion system DNA-binding domain-containing protein [Candidatus Competibacter denitrificans]